MEGLRYLEHATPDVILLDVDMPRLDGPSMVFRMRERGGGWERIPLILLSGSVEQAARALEAEGKGRALTTLALR